MCPRIGSSGSTLFHTSSKLVAQLSNCECSMTTYSPWAQFNSCLTNEVTCISQLNVRLHMHFPSAFFISFRTTSSEDIDPRVRMCSWPVKFVATLPKRDTDGNGTPCSWSVYSGWRAGTINLCESISSSRHNKNDQEEDEGCAQELSSYLHGDGEFAQQNLNFIFMVLCIVTLY